MKTINVIIVGGGYAGMYAAARVARLGHKARITLVEPNSHFVQRIRLHEAAAGTAIKSFAYANALSKKGITWVQGKLIELNLQQQTITVFGQNGTQKLDFDYLIYGVGSQFQLPQNLSGRDNVFALNSPADSEALHRQLKDKDSPQVLVLGAGLTGIELSTELASRLPHCQIAVLDKNDPFTPFSKSAKKHLKATFASLNISLIGGHIPSPEALDTYDAVIWCGGMQPNRGEPRWQVNEHLQLLDHPNVFVAGDSAQVNNIDGSIIRMGCVAAIPMGAHSGDSVVKLIKGQDLEPFQFAFPMRCISLGRKNGLIQFTHYDDEPKDKIVTGFRAAVIKELICRMTFDILRLELLTSKRLYQWIKPSPEDMANLQSSVEKS